MRAPPLPGLSGGSGHLDAPFVPGKAQGEGQRRTPGPRLGVDARLLHALPQWALSLGQVASHITHVDFSATTPQPGDVCIDIILFAAFGDDYSPRQLMDRVRRSLRQLPVIAVMDCDDPLGRAAMLMAGADEAISPDCHMQELAARMLALLRRVGSADARLQCDDLEIDLIERRVVRDGTDIRLPLREYDLLACLARSRDQVVARETLLKSVWRLNFDPGTNSIDVHIARLRQRIDRGRGHAMVRTVKGVGYALVSRAAVHRFAADIPAMEERGAGHGDLAR